MLVHERNESRKSQIKNPHKLNTIDRIDLENDFLKLDSSNNNPFPVDIFPKALQEIIFEAHNVYQFCLDYLGAGVLSAASAAIGKTYKVEVKKGWEEKVNLFTVIVGRPGDSKTHALNFCFRPIHKREDTTFEIYEQELKDYIQESLNTNEDRSKLKKPLLKKILISDFTPEALIAIHANNKKGLYVYVDELHGWIKNFNRYNTSGEAETYLSLWSGTQISTDRASGKSQRISDPFIGVIGSTQISVLKEFAKGGRQTNGFLDRFLFVYPWKSTTLKWNLNTIAQVHLDNYFTIISSLLDLESHEEKTSEVIPLSSQAKHYLFAWQNSRPNQYLFDYERSIDVKLQQYVIRFALILQLIEYVIEKGSNKQIELKAVKSGIRLFDYFYQNAIRVRQETTVRNYYESLTQLQRDILEELPKAFTTQEGLEIACKSLQGKNRISERQFKTYLNDTKLFKRCSRGHYEKVL
ncbi:DUF3987 domain-containing protein [Formosa sp. L2A11]|uniref:DUF3987 domain-containing protein n=1 Tax=Formosa sp. L2A11 TaxID=2686363 RepID=UPI00131A7B24|nr:DUF3987 domain-containing protein [Formosa sp. L2A11]